jgi:CheY-like chemotaxis protein
MWNRIRSLFAAPVFEGDEDKTRAARLVNNVIWFNLIVWGLALISMPLLPRGRTGLPIILALMLVAVGGIAALRSGRVQLVAGAFVLFLWLAVTILVALSGGIVNPQAMGFVIVIMAAGLLSRTRTAVIFTGLCILSAVGIFILEINNLLPTPLVIDSDVGLLVVIINILLTSSLLAVTLQDLKRSSQRVRQYTQALERERATLEERVEERAQSAELARQEAESATNELETRLWRIREQARFNEIMRGEQDIFTLATRVINALCHFMDAVAGAIFLYQGERYELVGSRAYTRRKSPNLQFKPGEGFVGQAALEKQMLILEPVPPGYMTIQSASMDIVPQQIAAIPFFFDDQTVGVIELASLGGFSDWQMEFMHDNMESVGLAFGTAQARDQVDRLLTRSRQQARELQVREEALQKANLELRKQAEDLRTSQEKLQENQVHLETANAELEEKTDVLQQQRTLLNQQNRELRAAQEELETKAEELVQANRYKSEFLANMSHELRTPLNSLLILARILTDNEDGNLTDDQVKSAQVIYNSGNDLLDLINDILDLSKVEAGRMEFHFQPMTPSELVDRMKVQFAPIAEEKNITFESAIADDLPASFETDPLRLQQIVKNLISNAFKFTEEGSVTLAINRPEEGIQLAKLGLNQENAIAIQVIDTGIGIPLEKQTMIFNAFQQAEGSTTRRYGGTGLGLAIASEMITHLGGDVLVESQPGEGSTFTVLHPIEQKPEPVVDDPALKLALPEAQPALTKESSVGLGLDTPSKMAPALQIDRPVPPSGDPVLLVVEDDPEFAGVLEDIAKKKGFHCLVAETGESGLELAVQHIPQAIILDLNLPGISGWDVLDALKQDATLRHIPVHIMSAEDESIEAFQRGVIGFLTKPISLESLEEAFQEIKSFISREVKSLLIVEDDDNVRYSLTELLSDANVEITEARLGKSALTHLHEHKFDCMILDLNLPDMTGFVILERMHKDDQIYKCPVIVYTGRELSEEENRQLMRYADSVIVKGVKSPERLLDETALFLHQVIADLPASKQQAIQKLYRQEDVLLDKKVLIVDDDMRNSFALSKLLGERGVQVEIAPNGQKALEILEDIPDIDLVLMDMMMPVMDGLEATRQIRQMPQFKALPILALTAKAMKGDREQCMAAGANDYLSKPIDPERLFSMLRVWLYDS